MKRMTNALSGIVIAACFLLPFSLAAQLKNKGDALLLKKNVNTGDKTLMAFTIDKSKTPVLHVGAGIFSVRLNSKSRSVELWNDAANKPVETYKQPRQDYSQLLSCQKQEQWQWDYFYTHIYPSIIARANLYCTKQLYCLMIYCNRQPRVSYLMAIGPTSRQCIRLSKPGIPPPNLRFRN